MNMLLNFITKPEFFIIIILIAFIIILLLKLSKVNSINKKLEKDNKEFYTATLNESAERSNKYVILQENYDILKRSYVNLRIDAEEKINKTNKENKLLTEANSKLTSQNMKMKKRLINYNAMLLFIRRMGEYKLFSKIRNTAIKINKTRERNELKIKMLSKYISKNKDILMTTINENRYLNAI